ncbi:MAG: hypothetical protein WA142_00760 [Rugosibacter sp.]
MTQKVPIGTQSAGVGEATDETPAQQEGAGQNPARFAVDALQGGRAKNAQLCRPGTPLCGQVSAP